MTDAFPRAKELDRRLPRFHARQAEAERQREIAQIVREANVHDEAIVTAAGATLPGDRRRLRGIPVVGGVTGTSPGTDPLAAALKAEADRERNRARLTTSDPQGTLTNARKRQ